MEFAFYQIHTQNNEKIDIFFKKENIPYHYLISLAFLLYYFSAQKSIKK